LRADDAFLLLRPRDQDAARREIARLLEIFKDGPRRHEIQVLAASLARRPAEGFRAVMLGGFEIERHAENSPGDAQFDGAYLDVGADDVTLYLIEAKSTLDTQAAVRQLRRRLRRLGWLEGAEIVPIEGGAEATVPVCLRA
jgi:hypothetical protein